MKTVMKKMFCLLLVAVMLVGVMPFAAFADSKWCDACGQDTHNTTDPHCEVCKYYIGHNSTCTSGCDKTAGCTWDKEHKAGCVSQIAACTHCGVAKDHLPENCPNYCTSCGQVGHDEKEEHCSICKYYSGHSSNCTSGCDKTAGCTWDKKHKDGCVSQIEACTHCGVAKDHLPENCPNYCTQCGQLGHDEAEEHCSVCKYYSGHSSNCTSGCDKTAGCTWDKKHKDGCVSQAKCDICKAEGQHLTENCPYAEKTCNNCKRTYKDIDGAHVCCDRCKELHATADCPYCAVCWDKGDQVKAHKTSAHCALCDKTDGTHKTDCENYVGSGSSYVKIHVNLYTSDTYTATKELVVYKDSSKDTIYYSLAEHNDLIVSELKKQYPDYSWSGHVYEAIKGDDGVEMSDEIGNGVTVYINAYCAEDLVLIAVHNGRTMSTLGDGYIHLYGKRVGETITRSEVIKAVSKQYNFSTLSMYSEQGWEDYVDGASVKSVDSLKITSDPYFIDVRVSGASKVTSSGSSYSADSSNPKTGDTIFAPIMIMSASVSALAVLFYLNKKRAY